MTRSPSIACRLSIAYSIALLMMLMLTACDGIGKVGTAEDNSDTDDSIDRQVADDNSLNQMISELNETALSSQNGLAPYPDKNAINGVTAEDRFAASLANDEINLARTSCGLNTLSADAELESVALHHANYINYVFANASPALFDAHSQSPIGDSDSDSAGVTGSSNPFFTGNELKDRMLSADYDNIAYGVAENIAQSSYYHSTGDMPASDIATISMTKSLLAAPYHLRTLMLPNSGVTGTAVKAYKPFNNDASTYQNYVLVNYAAATRTTKDVTFGGIFTYPCQGVTDTVTALYNETPDPFRGARNLETNPIGQPIYINVPTANTIKIRNISFYDVVRGSEVPTQLLDADQDPYKGTSYELPINEAFILPLTDRLQSCKHEPEVGQNCGLYGNSHYRVSFDVMIDNKALIHKSFSFRTGEMER